MWTDSMSEELKKQSQEAIFPLSHSPATPTELLSIHAAPPLPRQAQQKVF